MVLSLRQGHGLGRRIILLGLSLLFSCVLLHFCPLLGLFASELVLVLLEAQNVAFAVYEQVFARFQTRQDGRADPGQVAGVNFERQGFSGLSLRQQQLLLKDHLLLLLQVYKEHFDAVDGIVELRFTHA